MSTGGLEYEQLCEFLTHLGKEDPNTKFIRTHEPTDAEEDDKNPSSSDYRVAKTKIKGDDLQVYHLPGCLSI